MRIIYTSGQKIAEISVYGPCGLKIYDVPEVYSEDRLYVSRWAPGELEPVPACGRAEATLLAWVELVVDDDGALTLRKHYVVGGVRYAED
jgi:hypothetical protein